MLFPTIYSTLDPAALASFVSSQYELGDSRCQLIQRGVGDTYLITTSTNKFVLRIYRNDQRTFGHIQSEVELLSILRDNNVSVSYPIADRDEQYVQALDAAEGKRHAVLFSYAKGESPVKLSDTQLKVLGGEIAKFHNISSVAGLSNTRWTFDISTTLIEPINKTRHLFASLADELTWWVSVAGQAREYLESIPTDQFSTGYCHYDFLPKNFHFDDDNITLFDFDFFGKGWLVNDLMTFWTQLTLDVQINRMTQQDADHSFDLLLDAYRQHRSISDEELRAIPSLSIGWWCYYMGFHASHDQFLAFVQPGHLKMRTALIRQLAERNAKWSDRYC
ncbi:phosphotransferase [Chryseolinea sp. T2]|uniref:phosphotransferase enzyme family protein n=1 Tax=Chryseolinea sp. T2 TaxID=3129255 RepID=UPI0030775968